MEKGSTSGAGENPDSMGKIACPMGNPLEAPDLQKVFGGGATGLILKFLFLKNSERCKNPMAGLPGSPDSFGVWRSYRELRR